MSKYYTIKNMHIFVNCHSALDCSTAPPIRHLSAHLSAHVPLSSSPGGLHLSLWGRSEITLCVELVSVGCWVKEEARHTMCGPEHRGVIDLRTVICSEWLYTSSSSCRWRDMSGFSGMRKSYLWAFIGHISNNEHD